MVKITKTLMLVLTIFVFSGITFGQEQTTFQHTYGGSSDDNGYAMSHTLDGGLLMVGYTESFGSGDKDIYAVKTNGMGEVEWSKAYGKSGEDIGWKVVSTSDSGFVIVGTTNSYNSSNQDAILMKINKSGTVQWTTTIAGDSIEDAYNVIQSRNGGYYITGYTKTDTTEDDAFVAKLSSTGSILWYKKVGSLGNDEAYGLAEDRQGNIVICGMTTYDSITENGLAISNSDAFIGKLTKTGSLLWMKTYGTSVDDVAWSIAVDGNNYYITGWSNQGQSGDADILFMKTDTGGTLAKSLVYFSQGDDRAFDIEAIQGGDFVLTGYVDPHFGNREVVFLKINGSGTIIQDAIIGSTGADGHWPSEILPSNDGGFLMLSTTKSFSTSNDMFLIKLDENGGVSCNSNFSSINTLQIAMNSKKFGDIIGGVVVKSRTLTTSNSTTKDSTLCCKLIANPKADTLVLCKGSSVTIGNAGENALTYTWTEVGGSYTSSLIQPIVNPTSNTQYKVVVSSTNSTCLSDSGLVYVKVVDLLTEDFISDTSFCDGDSVTLKTTTTLISYQWVGNTINTSNSTIELKVTDTIHLTVIDANACVYRDTAIVTKDALPVFSLGNDTTICSNLSITLSGPSGVASYSWNNGSSTSQTLTTSGQNTHKLKVVDMNGCVYIDKINILTNPNSPFSLGTNDSFCEGASYTILGPGALSGYIWNGTASTNQNLTITQPGTYNLKAYNSFNCPSYDTIELFWKDAPTIDLGNDIVVCGGLSKTINGPSDMDEYLWSTGSTMQNLSVAVIGSYWLRVKDKGCFNRDTIIVTAANTPVITLGNDTTICDKDSLTLSPGSTFKSYTWSTGSSNESIVVKDKGTYSVTVTDNNDCTANSSITIDTTHCIIDGIFSLGFTDFNAFPNPTKSTIYLQLESTNSQALEFVFYDIQGRIVLKESRKIQVGGNQVAISIDELKNGTYWVRMHNDFGLSTFKLIKH